MTSMPASRSARAITLAPRSWPSRPGLATRTRILASVAIPRFNHKGPGRAMKLSRTKGLRAPNRAGLQGLDVHASPQIPARNAAIRLPGTCNLLHLQRLEELAFAVVPAHRHLN